MTNNAAEYNALIRALQRVEKYDAQPVAICSDSELLVKQITGEYRVKSETLARLYEQVQFLLLKLPRWSIRHVRRDQNKRADELANMAMDQQHHVLVFDVDPDIAVEADSPPTDTPSKPPPSAPEKPAAAPGVGQAARVSLVSSDETANCPAGNWLADPVTIEHTLPADFCVYAAHALAPTILAILSTNADEFAAVPTLTVKCTNPKCRATFHVAPTRPNNGAAKKDA
jgi:uncharacterized repeat protein (TIGR04076 family)